MEDRLGSESPELKRETVKSPLFLESSFSLLLLLQLKNQRLRDSRKKQLHGFVPAAYMVLTHKLVRQTTGRPAPWPHGSQQVVCTESGGTLWSVLSTARTDRPIWMLAACSLLEDGRHCPRQSPLLTATFANRTRVVLGVFQPHSGEALLWGYLMMLHHSPSDCCVNTAGK